MVFVSKIYALSVLINVDDLRVIIAKFNWLHMPRGNWITGVTFNVSNTGWSHWDCAVSCLLRMPILQNIKSCVRRKHGVTRRPTKVHFNVKIVDAFKSANIASQLRVIYDFCVS